MYFRMTKEEFYFLQDIYNERHKNQKHAVPRSNHYGGKNGCMFKFKANYREILLFYNKILEKSG